MRWIEIINVRVAAATAPSELARLFSDIRNNLSATRAQAAKVVIFRSGSVESDWAIHIHWETEEAPVGRTALGSELADTFRSMSLVDHTSWIEECRENG